MEYGLRYLGNGKVICMIYKLKLGSECIRQEEYLRVVLQLGIRMIFWFNQKWISMALRSVEAKNKATRTTGCDDIWLHKLLEDLYD